MSVHTVEAIRNIAFVGHGAAGKTSLVDALLYHAHAVERLGRVDDGTSFSDFDDEEHLRHFSIDTTVLHAEHHGKYLQLLDAPGYPDFVGAALTALNAVETAVIVVSGTAGIEVNTRRMFHEAGRRGLGRVIVLNKLDAEHVHLPELLDLLRATFGKQCVLFNVPNATGPGFTSVTRVLAPPEERSVDVADARSQLIDAIVDADETLMEKYLAEGTLSADELDAAVPHALAAGTVVPIFCISAKSGVGVPELLSALADELLSPLAGAERLSHYHVGDAGHEHPVQPTVEGEFVGQVFKTVNDKFVGHLSFIRVYEGRLTPDTPLVNLRTGKSARLNGLLIPQGQKFAPTKLAVAGDIVAVAKIDGLHIGDTVCSQAHADKLPTLPYPPPMFGLAVTPKKRGDEQKLATGLHKIAEEDPTFHVTHDPQTHELIISGVSQLHLEVIQHRLKQRFDLEIVTHEPKIAYRETVGKPATGEHRHKKQTGGRGQFAEVHLRIYPLPRTITNMDELLKQFANKERFEKLRAVQYDADCNFAFIDHIVGGTIPNQFIPAVEKGCKELLERGALAGFRLQDVAVEVYFGKDHPVDSSEAAFKAAGRIAFKKAVLAASPTLMEPIAHLEVTVPSKFTGAVLGDLNTKRARVENQDSLPGELAVITARVPLAEMTKYAAQLNSMSHGQGSYTLTLSHYDAAPAQVQAAVVSKAKLAVDEDE